MLSAKVIAMYLNGVIPNEAKKERDGFNTVPFFIYELHYLKFLLQVVYICLKFYL